MKDLNELSLFSVDSFIDILQQSQQNPQKIYAIFKHSTRCSISQMALNRMLKTSFFQENSIPFYYLDLIKHRNVSDLIAEKLSLEHQSPQILIIKNGVCIANESHNGISENWLTAHAI